MHCTHDEFGERPITKESIIVHIHFGGFKTQIVAIQFSCQSLVVDEKDGSSTLSHNHLRDDFLQLHPMVKLGKLSPIWKEIYLFL